MQSTAGMFDTYQPRPGQENPPGEAQCPVCFYWFIDHPDVQRICRDRDPSGKLLKLAACQCHRLEDQQRSALNRLHSEANLPHFEKPKTFDNFEAREGADELVQAARRFDRDEGPRILVLVGGNGCGKSHLLEAIGRSFLERERSVRYDLGGGLLQRFRNTFNPDNPEDLGGLITWYASRHVLLIDDIGMERATDFASEQLTYLVELRLQSGGRLAVATNQTFQEMTDHLGPRIADRLYSTNASLAEVALVVSKAKTYRR